MHVRYPLTLLYDGACPLCAHEIAALRLRDHAGRLAYLDVSDPAVGDPVLGVDRRDALSAMAAVDADGQILRGVDVFRAAYDAVGVRWIAPFTRLPLVKQLIEGGYPILARNRHRFPGWLAQRIFFLGLPKGACNGEVCAAPSPSASSRSTPSR